MERLTTHDPNRQLFVCSANYKSWNEIYDRLAAYEDTGLTPEEAEHTKNALAGKSLAETKENNGLSVQRMIELAQAEQEGRLVVLPCKDSPVWIVEEATHDCDTVPDKDCMSRTDCEGCPALKSYVRRLDEFYYTRADAEAALKGVSEDA